MSTTLSARSYWPSLSADAALKAAAMFWFTVLGVGQVVFVVSTGMFYLLTALHGDIQAWNKHLAHGYAAGDPVGNAVLIVHLVSAVLITLSGAIQFIPQVRRIAPRFHRWNGRIYIFTAFSVSLAGLYILLFRPATITLLQTISTGVLGILVMLCAAMALLYALKRDFARHRRWAFRLFLLASSALFIRAAITLSAMVLAGTGSADFSVIRGPVLTIMGFAQYCVPLAVLELYFLAKSHGGAPARVSMAAALVLITLVMGAGFAAASVAIYVPNIRAALDPRPSIAQALAQTITSEGVQAAAAQYYRLHAVQPAIYNFDEDELNTLGYDLIHAHKFADAIRILQLNTESYPKSGNTWDSLGEAYMDNGDTQAAIANYRKSLAINPANQNALAMLRKMHAG